MDAADERAREQKGYGDGLTQALSLVVAPVLFAAVGAWLDSTFHTAPFLLLALGFVGLLGAVITAYYEYRARVARHDEGKPWARNLR